MDAGRLSFLILLVSQLAATTGFMFVVPFMPLYVQSLGVESARDAAAWAGLLNAATAVSMALAAPLWGRLGDRYGQKKMLLRATFAGAVMLGLMGLVTAPWQLLALRLFQGALTGTVAAATVLVSATASKERAGSRLGTLQMVIFTAAAAGPFVGGMFADLVGIRASFGVTAALLAASGALVLFGVGEAKRREAEDEEVVGDGSLHLWRLAPVLVALFAVHASITGPVPALPGLLEGLTGSGERVASLAGQILGAGALAAALGAAAGGWLAARLGAKTVIAAALLFAGLAFLPQASAGGVGALFALRVTAAFFLGAVIPVANLAIRASVPEGRQGAAFGVSASVTSVAFGLGPLGGGMLAAAYGFGAPFVVPGFLLVAASAVIAATAVVGGGWLTAHLRSTKRLFKVALSWIVSL